MFSARQLIFTSSRLDQVSQKSQEDAFLLQAPQSEGCVVTGWSASAELSGRVDLGLLVGSAHAQTQHPKTKTRAAAAAADRVKIRPRQCADSTRPPQA